MPGRIHIVLLSGFCLLGTDPVLAQEKLSSRGLELEFILDAGTSLGRKSPFQSSQWTHEYSIRAGFGKSFSENLQFHIFLQYDLYHSTIQWGDMNRRVFDRQYPRHDPALYVSVTFWRWLVLGLGAITQLAPEMRYHNIDLGFVDTTMRILEASEPLKPYFLLGFKQDIQLTRDISIPVGVYFNSIMVFDPVFRIGVCKRF